MKQFNEFILEKVSKKEFEQALSSSSNIQGGAEFEFIVDEIYFDIKNSDMIEKEWDKLTNMFDDDINSYNKELEEYDEEKQRIYDLIDENKDHMENFEDEKNRLDDDDEERADEIDEEISVLEKWNDELETEYDELEMPYIERYTYDEMKIFIENNNGFFQDTFDRVIENNLGESLSFNLFNLEYHLFNTIDINDNGLNNEDFIDNSDAPFKDEDYDYDYKSSTAWNIEEDGSLPEGGIEITSPVKPVGEMIDAIEDMFDWIEDVGSTDNSCGFHVHLSTIEKKEFDAIKLLMFVEEDSILKYFKKRKFNSFTKPIEFLKDDYYTEKYLLNVLDKKKISKDLKNNEKYMGVHIVDLIDNHVEFRYMGGANYHKKFDEVKANIAKYSHWMEIATNPEYKRKEYLKKVNRALNKLKLGFFEQLLDYIKGEKQEEYKKKLKPYMKTYNMLKKTYKKGFNQSIDISEFDEFLKGL